VTSALHYAPLIIQPLNLAATTERHGARRVSCALACRASAPARPRQPSGSSVADDGDIERWCISMARVIATTSRRLDRLRGNVLGVLGVSAR